MSSVRNGFEQPSLAWPTSRPTAWYMPRALTSCPDLRPELRQVVGVISRHRPATMAAMCAEMGADYNALVPALDELVKLRKLRTEAGAAGVSWVAA